MGLVLDILSWAAIIIGSVFSIIGAIGIIRLPDVFCRMHGAGIIDTMGVGMIFLGLALQTGFNLTLAKLAMILLFVLFTSPTATHALARAARYSGVEPELDMPAKKEADPSNT
jgi:multicomponent Na+:H+ antiporter subunit G